MEKLPLSATAILTVTTAALANAFGISLDTLGTWHHYTANAAANVKTASTDRDFLRIDQSPEQLQRVQHGEIIVTPIATASDSKAPNGIIHDWVGTVFIPGATLADVMNVLDRYDRYPSWFGPTLVHAKLLEKNGDEERFTTLYVRTVLFVTVAVEMEYVSVYSPVNATRGYSISHTTHIDEIHNYGKPNQSKSPADDGSGYLWRAHNISKYEQRDNGVYIEQESIALSCPIPARYRWIVEPAARRLAKNLLESSLRQTRDAVRSTLAQ